MCSQADDPTQHDAPASNRKVQTDMDITLSREAISEVIKRTYGECPETPFGGSDEWDLCAAFSDGWMAALDAVWAALRADPSDTER